MANVILFLHVSGQSKSSKNLGKIRGIVIDSATTQPLEYATISLFRSNEKIPLNGTSTGKSGKFYIGDLPLGNYKLVVEFIGYKPTVLDDIKINDSIMSLDLKPVLLTRISAMLPSVLVYSPSSIIDDRIDKSVFNAQQDVTSQGGVATDILQKIPQVSVDADGTIELAGSSSIRFLIDGKPSSVFGSNINDVLQSIPANEIKDVEVITNPGAKYNAEGLGGIINIILKKSNKKGVNGDLSLTGGTRVENGSFNLNIRREDFGLTAFASGFDRLSANYPSTYQRVSYNSTNDTVTNLIQDGNSKAKRSSVLSGIGFDWNPSQKSFISGSIHYNNYERSGYGSNTQSQIISLNGGPGSTISDINSMNNSNYGSRFHTTDLSLYYRKSLAKEDQTLEISANSSLERSHDYSGNTQLLLPGDSAFYGIRNVNPGKEEESQFKVDYSDPFTKGGALAMGAELDLDDIRTWSSVLGYHPDQKVYSNDSSLMNNLDFHQSVYAAYTEFNFNLGKSLEVQMGGRYEHTVIKALYSYSLQSTNPNYNSFFPSVFLLRKFSKKQSLRFSYSRRIQRPDYDDLNPFINTSDPKNVTSGNPRLMPETGDILELSYSKDWGKRGSMIVTAFYRVNHHSIQNYVTYYPFLTIGDSTYSDVSVNTRENIGLEKNLGLNLYEGLDFSGKLDFRLNSFFYYRHTVNTIDSAGAMNSFNYRVNLNSTYKLSKSLDVEFFGNFNSLRHEAQGTYPAFVIYSFGLRKLFWNNGASLALTATNPFNEYINRNMSLSGPGFSVNNRLQLPFRSFGINFTWKFGKLEFRKLPEIEQVNPNQEPVD